MGPTARDVSIVATAAVVAILIVVIASVALSLKFMRGIVETPWRPAPAPAARPVAPPPFLSAPR